MAGIKVVLRVLMCLVLAFAAHRASAVTFEVIDLPDTVVGLDERAYVYQLSGAFSAFHGFNLLFEAVSFEGLSITSGLGSDWFQSETQPDAGAGLSGLLSSTALADIPQASGSFQVNFVWKGIGNPGQQSIEYFDDNFNVTSVGMTSLAAPVPEPSTYLLLAAGLMLVAARARTSLSKVTPACGSPT